MNHSGVRLCAAALLAALFLFPCRGNAQGLAGPPVVSALQNGATIEAVSIKTYGVTKPAIVRRYLSLHAGSRLSQSALNADFNNLQRLGGFIARVTVDSGAQPASVRLHWIVMDRWLRPTEHPFYRDQPLSGAIQGPGFIVTGNPVNTHGANFSGYTQFSQRVNLLRVLFTAPLSVDPQTGRANSLIVDAFGGRGVFRASEPEAVSVFSWNAGQEALFLSQRTTGTQVEGGVRVVHSTDELPSNIVAPSIYSTYQAPARATQLIAAISHGCTTPATQWYPPYCGFQYRFTATDAVGGLGATSTYRSFVADVARYFAIGSSTLAFHGNIARTGGVIPDSFLTCATARAYPKSFCGTDSEVGVAEFRLNDAKQRPLEFALFTESAASRVRQSENSNATPYFNWHPDTGVAVMYHLLRVDISYGKGGGRIFLELRGQSY
ncbi:MAG: hypothetical protein WBA06_08510 [Candidatus Aquilonibacter sp.]